MGSKKGNYFGLRGHVPLVYGKQEYGNNVSLTPYLVHQYPLYYPEKGH